MANIGRSISIKGDVIGDEDLVIEGRVEGRVELKGRQLTVGPNGDVTGEVRAKHVTVVGRLTGNVTAAERVEICDSGRLNGDVEAPRLTVQDGGQVNGAVAMRTPQAAPSANAAASNKKPDPPRVGPATPGTSTGAASGTPTPPTRNA